jgi:hypothetical protein
MTTLLPSSPVLRFSGIREAHYNTLKAAAYARRYAIEEDNSTQAPETSKQYRNIAFAYSDAALSDPGFIPYLRACHALNSQPFPLAGHMVTGPEVPQLSIRDYFNPQHWINRSITPLTLHKGLETFFQTLKLTLTLKQGSGVMPQNRAETFQLLDEQLKPNLSCWQA